MKSLAQIERYLHDSAERGVEAGYVALFARDGRVVGSAVTGHADLEAQRPMRRDTRFRVASMTKPVTAVAVCLLLDDGVVALDDPVAHYVPSVGRARVATQHRRDAAGRIPAIPLERPLCIRDLLTFRAGIAQDDEPSDLGEIWKANFIYAGEGSLADRVDRIFDAPLFEQPGTRWRYGWSADVLGRVVEVAAGEPFDAFLARRLFAPLGMEATGFLPREDDRADMATLYTRGASGGLERVDAPRSDAPDWPSGGGGLVSTADDFMRFALMLWGGGSLDGVRILEPDTVRQMTRVHVREGVLADHGVRGHGWGWGLAVVIDPDAAPTANRVGDFWWQGVYGTSFFVSPETGLVAVILTQHEPGPHSTFPEALPVVQALAFQGL